VSPLENCKTVLITGASRGIGRECAQLFAGQGWVVIAVVRTLEDHSPFICSNSQSITIFEADLSNLDEVDAIVQSFNEIDVLINNAGFGIAGLVRSTEISEIANMASTMIIGPIALCQGYIGVLEKRNGCFITVSSTAGIIAQPFGAAYSAIKHAMEGFSESLWYEGMISGFRVKLVVAGATNTEFVRRMFDRSKINADKQSAHLIDNFSRDHERRKDTLDSPQIVAQKVFDAASDQSSQLRYYVGTEPNRMLKLKSKLSESEFLEMLLKPHV